MYKAKMDIGDFKKGDVVPDEIAQIWDSMYKESPVELINHSKEIIKKETVEENPMIDDYLNRNENVVLSNLKKDKLSEDDASKMIEIEKKNKNRNKVLKALKKK